MKNKLAKIIRTIFIPPIIFLFFSIIVYIKKVDVYTNINDFIISIILLAVLPILAYPIVYIVNKEKEKNREKSRNMAFIFSFLGYLLAFAYGIITKVNSTLMIVYSVYLLSVLLLVIMNKIIGIRASGHATSISGPIYLFIFLKQYYFAFIFLIFYVIVFISSVYLKRHTKKEFIIGLFIPLIALVISLVFF